MPIAVVRAEAFYLPSHPQRPDAWALVAPAELVFRWYEERVQRRVRPPDGFVIGQKTYARINHNRWLADCPCGSAQVVSPADPRMACTECGYGWIVLVFPEDVTDVEASVANDLPHLRNWWHPGDPIHWGAPPSATVDPLAKEVAP
ncbi:MULTISPECIES: hypothetical protein [Streptomyces]|uniref:hypothetical protein n=1 Tax=Streptomyces TaxID=1883 RepID=UPI0029ACCA38|nr:hypothetical protein [Streptomyces stelliscabiei]MDX2520598.1 hypothetical protein [Streptomyces stelliscabiei]MDX2552695.1 hypothetical protein [Streptomyces stelliscabiei]MDX2661379.1 hypothetical protein [Streptomyces stelliscabiei]MDX2788860.1 hypothetical protein [Streptomyces stelliscabiei]